MRAARSLLLCVLAAGCFAPHPPAKHVAAAPAPADAGVDTASPPTPEPEPAPIDASMMYGAHRPRRDPNDLCEPVTENLRRSETSIVTSDRSNVGRVASQPWDPNRNPKYFDILDRRYRFTAGEKAMLKKNGFFVASRLPTRGYADALHDIYQSQLPIFISADAILHAVYKGNDSVLMEAEVELHEPLDKALGSMHETLAKSAYPADVMDDLDVYLTVARNLLRAEYEEKIDALRKPDLAKSLIESAEAGNGGLATTELFGRSRVIDWSQFMPRGHYTETPDLQTWFRASIWLSRLELNLVSRKSRSSQPGVVPNPEETPREAVDALALADLAERAGVLGTFDKIERVWSEFAGSREDVSLRDLLALRAKAGITTLSVPDSAVKLKAAIGADFQRTARFHYMPQGSTPLPAIATVLGPRVVPDAQVESSLAHSAVQNRLMPSFADVAYLLGSERATTYLAHDLGAFPELQGELTKGRATMHSFPRTSLYTAWLGAIADHQPAQSGEVPSFMTKPAYQDFKLNTTVAAYGQLRHNYVLVAGQAYDEGGCEIPDGYVEPAVGLYESLLAYAQRGKVAMQAIGGTAESIRYFDRLEKNLDVLVHVAKDETAGRALSEEEKRWLSMTSEIVPPSSDGPGSFDGWYFEMFRNEHDAFLEHAFVADWFTSSNANSVVYAGAREPRLGFFVVDVGGEPRVMVGPVARAFEHVGSLAGRLNDKDASKIGELREPWASSYTAVAPPIPPLEIVSLYDDNGSMSSFAVRSTRAVGDVTIELLGHHREVVAKGTGSVGAAYTRIKTPFPHPDEYAELVRIRAGGTTYELATGFGEVAESMGGMPPVDYEKIDAVRKRFSK